MAPRGGARAGTGLPADLPTKTIRVSLDFNSGFINNLSSTFMLVATEESMIEVLCFP